MNAELWIKNKPINPNHDIGIFLLTMSPCFQFHPTLFPLRCFPLRVWIYDSMLWMTKTASPVTKSCGQLQMFRSQLGGGALMSPLGGNVFMLGPMNCSSVLFVDTILTKWQSVRKLKKCIRMFCLKDFILGAVGSNSKRISISVCSIHA